MGPTSKTQPEIATGTAWFYHTVGSGIFLESPVDQVIYARRFAPRRKLGPPVTMSVPRVELLVKHQTTLYWPASLRFRLANGELCHRNQSSSEETDLLVCRNLPVRICSGRRDRCRGNEWDSPHLTDAYMLERRNDCNLFPGTSSHF